MTIDLLLELIKSMGKMIFMQMKQTLQILIPEFFKLDWDEIRRYNRTNRWADEELRRSLRDLVATTEDGVEQPLFLRFNERQDGAYGGEEYNTRVFVYKYSVLDIDDRASRKDQREYQDYETSEDPEGKTDRK